LPPAAPGTDVQIVSKTPAEIAAREVLWRDATEEQLTRAQSLAETLGYDQELSLPALTDRVHFYARRTAEDLLEMGRALLLIKELVPHGGFGEYLASVGFRSRAAQKFMQAAEFAAKSAVAAHLMGRIKSPSVVFEFISVDDEVLEEFGEMDDIERMSAPEVRRRLRDLRADLDAKDSRIAKREQEVQQLTSQLRKVKGERAKATPDQKASDRRTQCQIAAMQVKADLVSTGGETRSLRSSIIELVELGGVDHHDFLAGLIGELLKSIRVLRDEFDLPIVNDHGDPEWMKGI
jgi:hypothetical protein